jgi:uncharacterized protein YabN with tetrapyrrole methylase and pyrophosphatase domain
MATIVAAERLFYLVTDAASSVWLRGLNPGATSLHDCYRHGEEGTVAATRMAEKVVAPLRTGADVCVAFYGHPTVLMHATRLAAEQARAEGFVVRIFPAISSEDCLIADLGVDPAVPGRLLFDATDFVVRPRRIDTSAALVLLQIGAVGQAVFHAGRIANREGLRALAEVLLRHYPGDHRVAIYEICLVPPFEANVQYVALADLGDAAATVVSTLYVPPLLAPPIDDSRAQRLRATLAGAEPIA